MSMKYEIEAVEAVFHDNESTAGVWFELRGPSGVERKMERIALVRSEEAAQFFLLSCSNAEAEVKRVAYDAMVKSLALVAPEPVITEVSSGESESPEPILNADSEF